MDWVAHFAGGAFYFVCGSILTETFWSSDGNDFADNDHDCVV